MSLAEEIMTVPEHDSRNYEFATKYNLPVRQVVIPKYDSGYSTDKAYKGEGIMINMKVGTEIGPMKGSRVVFNASVTAMKSQTN